MRAHARSLMFSLRKISILPFVEDAPVGWVLLALNTNDSGLAWLRVESYPLDSTRREMLKGTLWFQLGRGRCINLRTVVSLGAVFSPVRNRIQSPVGYISLYFPSSYPFTVYRTFGIYLEQPSPQAAEKPFEMRISWALMPISMLDYYHCLDRNCSTR